MQISLGGWLFSTDMMFLTEQCATDIYQYCQALKRYIYFGAELEGFGFLHEGIVERFEKEG